MTKYVLAIFALLFTTASSAATLYCSGVENHVIGSGDVRVTLAVHLKTPQRDGKVLHFDDGVGMIRLFQRKSEQHTFKMFDSIDINYVKGTVRRLQSGPLYVVHFDVYENGDDSLSLMSIDGTTSSSNQLRTFSERFRSPRHFLSIAMECEYNGLLPRGH